jgi:hypothetical protein
VAAELAKALFYHVWKQGLVQPGIRFIVGRHGDDLVKNAIKECLGKVAMEYTYKKHPDGLVNEGSLIVIRETLQHAPHVGSRDHGLEG